MAVAQFTSQRLKAGECANVAELVDALDLGSSGVTRGSSTLPIRTNFLILAKKYNSIAWPNGPEPV